MSVSRQGKDPDLSSALIVGEVEMSPPGHLPTHSHARHQLIYAVQGVVHLATSAGEWVLPPTRALWVAADVPHSFTLKRSAETCVLYIDSEKFDAFEGDDCVVLEVTPLIRELISTCAAFPWDYGDDTPEGRLAVVLMEQVKAMSQAPVSLPLPTDPRALRVVEILRSEPHNRETLAQLAKRAAASTRTIERLFEKETRLSFGTWRNRQRLIAAMERLAYGDSVTATALDVGYESPSSFIVAFRAAFGTTPARYFKQRK